MKKRISQFLIALIVLLAFVLRFYNLSSNPPSLTWDEAAWGYNAYSLGINGKDEFGKFLPITYLESFGDFKPPVYAYLSVIPVKAFGLNEFSIRFASALFGVLTVLLTYFLVKQIFIDRRSKTKDSSLESIALLSALVLAVSPWHVLLSRAAFEANVATFFIAMGSYLFLLSRSKKWLLVVSVISFVISMYTFNTARIVSPLLLLGLVFAFRKEMLESKKEFIASVIVGGLLFIPLFLFLLTPQAKLRYTEVNIFSDPAVVKVSNQQIQNDNNAVWSKIIHNRRVGYSVSYIQHYFDNLSPDFLFIKGDGNPKFSIQSVGQMYIFEIPLFIAGVLFLFRKRVGAWWLVPYWIIVGIIPAAVARETPHALRIETTLPMFQILTAYGAYWLYRLVSSMKAKVLNIKISRLIIVLFGLLALGNFVYFVHDYFIHYPRLYSAEWQYGYKDAVSFINENSKKYDNIIFTEDLGRPYIYALVYEKYNPAKFASEAKVDREAAGFVHVRSFGNQKFVKDVVNNIDPSENNLYIDTSGKQPKGAKIIAEFKLLDGKPGLVAYTL